MRLPQSWCEQRHYVKVLKSLLPPLPTSIDFRLNVHFLQLDTLFCSPEASQAHYSSNREKIKTPPPIDHKKSLTHKTNSSAGRGRLM